MIKRLIINFEKSKKELDKIKKEWEENPESTELEYKYDSLYKSYFILFSEMQKYLVNITKNKINAQMARKLLTTRYEDTKKLLLKLA